MNQSERCIYNLKQIKFMMHEKCESEVQKYLEAHYKSTEVVQKLCTRSQC